MYASSRRKAFAALVTAIFTVSGPLQAAAPEMIHVGRAKVVVQNVRAQFGDQAPKQISVDERLHFNERVLTTGDSRSVVEFRDGSVLQVGPNAIVILDRFVFNPFESKSEKVITAVSGAFRYISGMKTKSSSLEIRTASATIGIRGSLSDFMVYPGLPTFVAMRHGFATVRNDRGAVQVRPGQAMAVQSRNIPMPTPDRIPAAVAVQALQHINNQVGAVPPSSVLSPVARGEAQVDAAVNALPAAQQIALQGGAPGALPAVGGPLPPANLPAGGPPAGVNLLSQAAQVGLLDGGGPPLLTPAQQAFVARANTVIPNAAQQMQSAVGTAEQQTRSNGSRSAEVIVKAAAEFAPAPDTVAQLLNVSAQADGDAAVVIAQAALAGAPGLAVQIAGAAAAGAPDVAALIAGGIARARPDLAAAISVVVSNANSAAAGAILTAIAQNVPAAQAAEALAAVSAVLPGVSSTLVAAVATVSPEAAALALSQISTAAGGDQTQTTNNTAPPPPPPPTSGTLFTGSSS